MSEENTQNENEQPASTSVENIPEEATENFQIPDELEVLKNRARIMGIQFSNNIGIDTLRERIRAKLEEDGSGEDNEPPVNPDDIPEDAPVLEEGTVLQVEKIAEPETLSEEAALAQLEEAAAALGLKLVNPAEEAVEHVRRPVARPAMGVGRTSPVATKVQRDAAVRKKLHDEKMKLVRVRITCLDPKKKDLPGEIITIANRYLGTVRKFVPFGEATENGYHIPQVMYDFLKDRKFLQVRTLRGKNGTPEVKTEYVREFAIEVLPPLTAKELQDLANQQAAGGSIDKNPGSI